MASIGDALFSARAGLQSHGTAISVLADNIANANTVAYKASRAEFTDLLAGSSGGAGGSVGSGSQIGGITQVFSQGTFEFTGRDLDVGIDGGGFFAVQGDTGRFYTRAGNFKIDKEGNLLNQNSLQVMGFSSSGAGGLTALNVNDRGSVDAQTSNVVITGNLDASTPATSVVPVAPASFTALNNAADFSTFVQVFDSLGASHDVTMYFFHTASNTGQVQGYVDSSEVGGAAGLPSAVFAAPLSMAYSNAGIGPVSPASDITSNIAWSNGAAAGAIDFSFNPFTQFASPSNIASISQDGVGSGSVVSFTISDDGAVFAQLDNGQSTTIGTIALVSFSNEEGLRRLGDGLYAESTNSGEPVVGTPGVGQFGALQSGALELSTSDIAADFIKLISYQRGFQGSSRVITAVNDLMNEIINLA